MFRSHRVCLGKSAIYGIIYSFFFSFFFFLKGSTFLRGLQVEQLFPAYGRNCRNRNIQSREAEQFQKLLTCSQTLFSLFSAHVIPLLRIYSYPIIFRRDFRGKSSRKTHRRYSISDEYVYRAI